MVSWDMCLPWSLRWPDICSGDHCSFLSRLSTSCRSSLPTARFPGCLCLWYTAFLWAVSQTYLPRLPVLRLSSRVMVEGCTPIALAMALFASPFCNNTEIVYLCSEVSCLYISNANLTDFWETVVSLSRFFALPVETGVSVGVGSPLRYAPISAAHSRLLIISQACSSVVSSLSIMPVQTPISPTTPTRWGPCTMEHWNAVPRLLQEPMC